ncbi:hypothetical protein U8V72_20955 [Priestia filamentosa]|uniref:hypothetical protein n=1 Tax=Priestia filamentosa TaxID=1402861 RepID=UPI00397B339A
MSKQKNEIYTSKDSEKLKEILEQHKKEKNKEVEGLKKNFTNLLDKAGKKLEKDKK